MMNSSTSAFRRFCEIVGIAPNARFATNALRVQHREDLCALIRAATATWDRDALLAALTDQGVPAGPINTVGQAFADPQVIHRAMQMSLPRDGAPDAPGVRTPIRFSDADLALGRAAPRLGES